MSKKIRKRERIGEALVRMGFMTKDQVDSVLNAQLSTEGKLFGTIAIAMGYVNEAAVEECVDEQSIKESFV